MNVATGGGGQALWIHMDLNWDSVVRPDPEHDIWYILVIDLLYV